MQQAAIYARYSTDEQRETSIDDQIRRCKEVAQREKYVVPDDLIFFDAAITGTEKGLKKRTGYQAMMKAWDDGKFNALVSDEISRLARDPIELAKVQAKVESSGVRLLTADGTDSCNPNWQLMYQIVAAINQHFIRETRFRVVRGMVGQLERGYMIATPPYGYDIEPVNDESGEQIGTHWRINDAEAEIVREMYNMRKAGQAYAQIAHELNARGIVPPRKSTHGKFGYWRQGSVYRLLANSIYRGVFIWHGSTAYAAKAKKDHQQLGMLEYQRPELRLVDDETWNLCVTGRVSRTKYGGGKHMLAGFISCGKCGGTLCVSSACNKVRSLYCPQCALEKRVVPGIEKGPGYIATSGVEHLIRYLIERIVDNQETMTTIKNKLRDRLTKGSDGEIKALREKVAKADKNCARMAQLLTVVDDNEHLVKESKLVFSKHKQLKARLAAMEDGHAKQDRTAIERQLQVTPSSLVDLLFNQKHVAPERIRAILTRLFPHFIALGKPSRYESHFEVTVRPGAALAELSNSEMIEDMGITARFRVISSPVRPTPWRIEVMSITA